MSCRGTGRSASALSGASAATSVASHFDPELRYLRDRVEDVAKQVREMKRFIANEAAIAKKQTVLSTEERRFVDAEERRVEKWTKRSESILERHRERAILQIKKLNSDTDSFGNKMSRSETCTKVTCTPGRSGTAPTAAVNTAALIQGSARGSKLVVRSPVVAMTPRTRDTVREKERQLTQTLLTERDQRLLQIRSRELATRAEQLNAAEHRRFEKTNRKSRDKLEMMLDNLSAQLAELMEGRQHAESDRQQADRGLRETESDVVARRERSRSRERTTLHLRQEDEAATAAVIVLRSKRDAAKRDACAQNEANRTLRRSSSWSERLQAQRAEVCERATARVSRLEAKAKDLPTYTPGRKTPVRVGADESQNDNSDEEEQEEAEEDAPSVHEM